MPTFCFKGRRLTARINRLLCLADRRRRLEGHANHDRFAVADAPLNPAGIVGGGVQAPIGGGEEGIVVLTALEQGPGKARANLKALGGGQRHHRLGQIRFELVEDGHAQSGGDAADDTFDDATAGVAFAANRFDALDHPFGNGTIGTAHDVAFNGIEGHGRWIDLRLDVVNALDPGHDFGAVGLVEQLFGNRTGGYAADCFPG